MDGRELVSIEKAAVRFGISEADVEELVDMGRLSLHRRDGDVWLDADEAAAVARERPLANVKERTDRAAHIAARTPTARIREMRELGEREVTASEAAGLLGVSPRQVFHLLKEGRLNGEKRGGRRWIDLMEVELYAMSQTYWARRDGRWTAYGKQERKETHAGLPVVAAARERAAHGGSGGSGGFVEAMIGGERRLDLKQAADMLCLSKASVFRLAQSGQLPFQREMRRDPEISPRRINRQILTFSLADVLAVADRRERRASQRAISPAAWNLKTAGKPFIRTKIETPPGDLLVSVAEAASLLGVCQSSISNLVRRGRLFGWQTHPGKHGCRLWLSGNQVQRYANDPDRLRRREALIRGPREPSAPGQETNDEIWRQEAGLEDGMERSVRSTLERDYGEFFNSRQAAHTLGVTRGAVRVLRERGRLSGYQKPRTMKDGGGCKWWFYRKTDVYDLLAD